MPPHRTNGGLSPLTAYTKMMSAWDIEDLDRMFRYISHDAVHRSNIDGAVMPEASSAVGAEAMRARFALMLANFEKQKFDTVKLTTDLRFARATVEYRYRHRATGEIIESSLRLVCQMEDGLFVRLEEYCDKEYVESFARLISRQPDPTPPEREGRQD